MTTYTSVDGGYCVTVYKSFAKLWADVSRAHRRTEESEPLWLDSNESKRLTKAALKAELDSDYTARIFETGESDWTLKIEKH